MLTEDESLVHHNTVKLHQKLNQFGEMHLYIDCSIGIEYIINMAQYIRELIGV